jgi:hypothetical protein
MKGTFVAQGVLVPWDRVLMDLFLIGELVGRHCWPAHVCHWQQHSQCSLTQIFNPAKIDIRLQYLLDVNNMFYVKAVCLHSYLFRHHLSKWFSTRGTCANRTAHCNTEHDSWLPFKTRLIIRTEVDFAHCSNLIDIKRTYEYISCHGPRQGFWPSTADLNYVLIDGADCPVRLTRTAVRVKILYETIFQLYMRYYLYWHRG